MSDRPRLAVNRRTLKNVLFPALTLGAGVIVVLLVISNREVKPAEASTTARAETRPTLLPDGSPVPLDPAFLLPVPAARAKIPLASRFDFPLGSEHGALTYDAQPFLRLNRDMGGKHLGDDLNGIGGRDTDLGDPVYAIGDGKVLFASEAGSGWGKMILVAHALAPKENGHRPVVQSVYAHLGSTDVAAGMSVRRGDRLGAVGNADGAYFAHLHFEIRDSESPDPSRGYSQLGPMNRLAPTKWLTDHRSAPDNLLNAPPRDPVPFFQVIDNEE